MTGTSDRRDEASWRDYLSHPDSLQRVGRRFFSRIPSEPRCQLCAAPFAAPGGTLMRLIGKRPSSGNPSVCKSCQTPLLGANHAERAVDAARDLLRATDHGEPAGPWVPLGAGVHTGRAWFGAVGEGTKTELTVVGDVVNTTARLASVAAAGEILVSTDAASAAGLDPTLERRSLELKGKQNPTDVVSLRVSPAMAE